MILFLLLLLLLLVPIVLVAVVQLLLVLPLSLSLLLLLLLLLLQPRTYLVKLFQFGLQFGRARGLAVVGGATTAERLSSWLLLGLAQSNLDPLVPLLSRIVLQSALVATAAVIGC